MPHSSAYPLSRSWNDRCNARLDDAAESGSRILIYEKGFLLQGFLQGRIKSHGTVAVNMKLNSWQHNVDEIR